MASEINAPQVMSKGIKKVEPLNWWVGMRTPLQLMIYGEDLEGCTVKANHPGIEIIEVHQAESPNYLFVDIRLATDLPAGDYKFTLTRQGKKEEFTYSILKRSKGSASRRSFSPADMVYLIMPDRFCNGDPSINETCETAEKIKRKDPFGRHGGDLQGIINRMDYFLELGATALWITPVQTDNEPYESYHGYAAADYYHVDPRFGDNDKYRELVECAHSKGLKVIMDAVPNHCGTAHWWMNDLPFKDWVHQYDKFTVSNFKFASVSDPNGSMYDKLGCTNAWFDKTMPDMGTENSFVVKYLMQVYIWWIEWANLDGLRVDTFPYNEKNGIARWTKGILTEYPNLNITAETWDYSPAIVSYWDGGAKNRDGYKSYLPSVMDFPLQGAISHALAVDSPGYGDGMMKVYDILSCDMLYSDPMNLLIFLDNHDVPRFADMMKGNPDKVKMGLTMLATLRGIPQLYCGTELMFRAMDITQGHGGARIDFPGGWDGDPTDWFDPQHRRGQKLDVFEHTKKLFNWRKTSNAIHRGKTMHFIPEDNTYAYFRYTDNELVFVFINASKGMKKVDWQRFREITQGYSEGESILDKRKVVIGQKLIVKSRSSVVVEFFKD